METGLLRLQHLTAPGQRATRSHTGDQDIGFTRRVMPDFQRGGVAVDGGIGRVGELARHHGAGRFRNDFLGFGNRALHPLGGFGEDKFSAQMGQQFAALDRHAFRHGQDEAVSPGRGDKGQGDARIARGRLHHDAAFAQFPGRFQRIDHRHADPVLHRGQRVEEFQLGQDASLGAMRLRQLFQLDKRCVSNGLID